MKILILNFFYHLRHGCIRTRRFQWGFCWYWRYKNHSFCWKHGFSGAFNHEWFYWLCKKCHPNVRNVY